MAHAKFKNAASGMKFLAEEVRVVDTMVCFPLFHYIQGGPLWFHYDCRCTAEAEVLAMQVRRETNKIWREYSTEPQPVLTNKDLENK